MRARSRSPAGEATSLPERIGNPDSLGGATGNEREADRPLGQIRYPRIWWQECNRSLAGDAFEKRKGLGDGAGTGDPGPGAGAGGRDPGLGAGAGNPGPGAGAGGGARLRGGKRSEGEMLAIFSRTFSRPARAPLSGAGAGGGLQAARGEALGGGNARELARSKTRIARRDTRKKTPKRRPQTNRHVPPPNPPPPPPSSLTTCSGRDALYARALHAQRARKARRKRAWGRVSDPVKRA